MPVKADDMGTAIPGIDVYQGQKTIDWSAVKNSGIQFAMIRDGYGGNPGSWDNQKDEYFEQNYAGATAAGIKVGAYHYSYATSVQEASNEADECLYILNGRHLDYPVVYDVEDSKQSGLSSETLGEMVQTFCSKLQQAGYKVAVYSFKNFYLSHLNSPLVSQYDTWIAQFGVSTPNFSHYTMWQYTSSGSVPGISGACDMDYSYIDYSNGGGSTPTTLDPLDFKCDTSSYTFGSNRNYTYKITTPDTYPPTAQSSNSSAVTVSGPTSTYHGYLFTLTNVGAGDATITTTAGDGRSVSFKATGSGTTSSGSASSGAASSGTTGALRSDTSSYTFGPGRYVYTYKITTNASTAPVAASSDTSVATVAYSKRTSGGYLYKITNVGAGTATITTTAADGSSVSFPATGVKQASAIDALQSDTPYNFSMKKGAYYTYKFTGAPGTSYRFVCAATNVIRSASLNKLNGSYYLKIYTMGKGQAGIYVTGGGQSKRAGIVTVS